MILPVKTQCRRHRRVMEVILLKQKQIKCPYCHAHASLRPASLVYGSTPQTRGKFLYLELFRQGRKALDEHSPTVTELALSILNRIFQDIDRDCSQCEFEALSSEEQLAELKCAEESRQAWKQYIASLKEMVGSMTGKTNDHTASKNAATIHKEDTK